MSLAHSFLKAIGTFGLIKLTTPNRTTTNPRIALTSFTCSGHPNHGAVIGGPPMIEQDRGPEFSWMMELSPRHDNQSSDEKQQSEEDGRNPLGARFQTVPHARKRIDLRCTAVEPHVELGESSWEQELGDAEDHHCSSHGLHTLRRHM